MKLNFVIDASGIFYRSLYTLGHFGAKKGQKLLATEESKGVFMRKLATDFSALIKSVDNLHRVIVCIDSSSWRKGVPIEGGGYKSGRKDKKEQEESTVDWDSFFELTQEFTEILGLRGYLISKVKDAEADDLLFLWSRKLNALGESVIMVTGDKDLHQVINVHPNGAWTVALDPVADRRKVILTQEAHDLSSTATETEVDFFNPDTWLSSSGDFLTTLLSKNDVKIVDPVQVATRKVILGDHGDSVPGIATWKDPKDPEKERSMTENKLEKVLATMPVLTWRDLRDGAYVKELTASINAVNKKSFTVEEIEKKIQRNIVLVVLDEETIPKQIQTNFEILFEKVASSPLHLSREAILEGTKWWTKRAFVPKSFDVSFDGIEESKEGAGLVMTSSPLSINKKNADPLF